MFKFMRDRVARVKNYLSDIKENDPELQGLLELGSSVVLLFFSAYMLRLSGDRSPAILKTLLLLAFYFVACCCMLYLGLKLIPSRVLGNIVRRIVRSRSIRARLCEHFRDDEAMQLCRADTEEMYPNVERKQGEEAARRWKEEEITSTIVHILRKRIIGVLKRIRA